MLICEWCRKEYLNRSHHVTRFCSGSCATKKQYSEGKVALTILARKGWKGVRNSGRTRFKKGSIPVNFKGDKVGYSALHGWVYRHKGKPKKCESCDSVKSLQWANKSHEYNRDLEDWVPLCYWCHRKYDYGKDLSAT